MDLIQSLESCPIGDGDLLGQPFKVLPYQRKFLAGAFAPGVMRAGFSAARGSGKTGLSSALALAAVRPAGSLHKAGGEVILIASAFAQARLGFEAVKASLGLMGEAGDYRILDQQNMALIQHKETGARLRVLGADAKRAHGLRFNLAVCDEPAQWGVRGELLASAVKTALGKRKGARAVFLGTRPASDSHFFARLLAENDPSVFSLTFAAGPDDDPFKVSTWRKANPGLSYGLPDIEVLRAEARMARRDPGELATFRALRLNGGTSEVERPMLIDAESWRRVEADTLPERDGPCVWGVDLGGTAAFSAAAGFWPKTGRLEGFVSCGSIPTLRERALADGLPGVYEQMERAGELVQLGGRVVPVGAFLGECVRRFGRPVSLAADRWREGELTDGCRESGLSLPVPTWRGQGWRDQSQDVRSFRAAVLEGQVSAPVSLAMRAAFSECVTVTDGASNAKIAKNSESGRRKRGRDDLAVAICLAVAEGVRWLARAPKRSWRYRGMAG